MDYCVFIQANEKQYLGALVARYALRRHSAHNDKFDIRIMNYADFPFLRAQEGNTYLRDGGKREWVKDDLQSFTPMRFLPPQLMDFQGRAVVIDPDVFARADIWELCRAICRARRSCAGQSRAPRGDVVVLLPV